jgi:16S rRNA (cytosine967-C5)-methyltransferase
MKLHPSLIAGVVTCLERTFIDNRKADKVLAELFKQNSKWGSRDRGFVAENSYDIVRWWRKLRYIIGIDSEAVTIDNIKHIVDLWLTINGFEILDGKLDPKALQKKYNDPKLPRSVKYSIPDWLDQMGVNQLGEDEWIKILDGFNIQAPVFIRANTAKNTRDELVEILAKNNITTQIVPESNVALKLVKRQNVFITPAFKEGRFEVQDPGSQMIVDMLDLASGMRVIDACAGAGGKSLYISNKMNNKGQIISLDVEQWKLDELKKRARRNGAGNIETRLIIAKTIKRLKDSADRVLLDVPCSGLGTIRRNPDAKWKLSENFISDVMTLQTKILFEYSKMVKQGGILVYATCSILPCENEDQVKRFLSNHPNFELINERRTDTLTSGFDGFYMAQMKRIE